MVGDDAIADIFGAANAGIRSIAFRCPLAEHATRSATTMLEVQSVVANMFGLNALKASY